MVINFKKIIVRIAVVLVMVSILGYIFWPESKPVKIVSETTSPTVTLAVVQDAPCLVFYVKDKDATVFAETACMSTYIQKYKAGYYINLKLVCRSSSDGKNINRNNLSEKRMKSLQFNLLEKGIPYDSIEALSVGDTSPYPGIDPESEDGKMVNRSCEITGEVKQ
jgi:hypothetical protein